MDSTASLMEEDDHAVDVNIIYFIRNFLITRTIEKTETKTLYRSIFQNDGNFQDVLDAVNNLLEKSKLRIKLATCEVTSKEYYCLHSTFYKPDLVWGNSSYTDHQLDYFQSVLKQIIVSENGTISSMECLNLKTRLSKNDAQNFLLDLIENNLLLKLSRGKLTVSALAICELYPFFEHHFQEALSSCEVCKKPIIYSILCPNCGIRVHKHCFVKYKGQMKRPKCPKCNAAWADNMNDE